MILRFAVLVLALAVPAWASMAATDTDADRLRKILEQKYKKDAKPRSGTQPAPSPSDLYVIDPDGKVRSVNPSKTKTDDRSSVSPWPVRLVGSGLAVSADEQQHQMVVNRRIVVVQLKPDTSEAEIERLIAKFGLNVVDAVPSLGALYVELSDEDLPDAQGISPEGRSSVRTLLEPEIVVQLRNEPSVNAAFVQSSVLPKTIPPPSATEIERETGAVRWNWLIGSTDDGNWGLKSLHMPQVWTILSRHRRLQGAASPASIAVLDSGFGRHAQIVYQNVKGLLPEELVPADCARSHGTHVTGIIAARRDTSAGIDGIVPRARLDAVPISRNLVLEGTLDGAERPQLHLSYFADVIRDLGEYFDEFPLTPQERRVVNVSLAYNWGWVRRINATNPTTDQSVRNQVQQHANFIQYLVDRVDRQVLFVAAAGNDSDGAADPLNAKLATPFAFAALHETAYFKPSKNIIVVEAHDRLKQRAAFSNTGGHVSAPGVDVMSTLSSQARPYGLCSGTSQAAPHVTALAAILFELDSTKSPAEIIEIIKDSAAPQSSGGAAPAVDALSAVLELGGKNLRLLADLNEDGQVDGKDLDAFKADLVTLESGRFGEAITQDLNGDGLVDHTERCWPRVDLNGSGRASYDAQDKRLVAGAMLSDLDVLEAAWTDDTQTFGQALRLSGLSDLIAVWQGTALVAASPLLMEKMPCQ